MISPSEQVSWLPVSAGDMSGGIWKTACFLFILQNQEEKALVIALKRHSLLRNPDQYATVKPTCKHCQLKAQDILVM